MLSRKEFVEVNDWVVLVTSVDTLQLVQATRSGAFSSKDGNFKTENLVGLRYGGKIYNNMSSGYMTILHPTAYLWPSIVDFRTQILYQQDISLIQYFLDLKPGSVVIESGTGSGVLTTSLARSVAPHGHIHTFEFHPERVKQAQIDFANNKLDTVVTCRQRDILERGFPFFPDGVDAAFLDLPAPHDVIPSVDRCLRPQGRICNFSPCIEQVQRVCLKLQELGYEEIFTVEILAKEYELITTSTIHALQYNQGISLNGLVSVNGPATAVSGNQYSVGQLTFINESARQLTQRRQQNEKARQEAKKATQAKTSTQVSDPAVATEEAMKKQKVGEETETTLELCQLPVIDTTTPVTMADGTVSEVEIVPTLAQNDTIFKTLPNAEIKFPIQARPAVTMRGHTGYLTFARKRASLDPKENVIYATPFGQSKLPAEVVAAVVAQTDAAPTPPAAE